MKTSNTHWLQAQAILRRLEIKVKQRGIFITFDATL
jgi:hypothetical protein